jgi:hypothetical protein
MMMRSLLFSAFFLLLGPLYAGTPAAFELSASVSIGTAPVPRGFGLERVESLQRLYLPRYELISQPLAGKKPIFNELEAQHWPAWQQALSGAGREHRALVMGLVVNPHLPSGEDYQVDGLRNLFRDPDLGQQAAAELIADAKRDHLDGLALAFRGELPEASGAYAQWARALRDQAHKAGLALDVYLEPKTGLMENRRNAGVQSYDALGALADRVVVGLAAVRSGLGGVSAAQQDMAEEQLQYVEAHLPLERTFLAGECGGMLYQENRVSRLSLGDLKRVLSRGYKAQRDPDGTLRVEMDGRQARFSDATTVVRWVSLVRKHHLGGVVLGDLNRMDPGFWKWWDMNHASLGLSNAPAGKP